MQVQDAIVKAIQYARFIAYSCDEVTTISIGSWICVHVYTVDSWTKVLIYCFVLKGLWMGMTLTISLKSLSQP
jgi:hypothetical protein